MRILIDGHMLGANETGNETYIRGLLRGFADLGVALDVALTSEQALPVPHVAHRVSSANARRLMVDLPLLAEHIDADLIHCTYVAPPVANRPVVVTVHDLSFLTRPDLFTTRDRAVLSAGVPLSVRAADLVIVPSVHARNEVLHHLSVEPSLVVAIPEGVEPEFHPRDAAEMQRMRRELGLPTPYVLFVGALQPRKNPRRMLEAWKMLVDADATEDCRLVLTGGSRGRRQDVESWIVELGLARHVELLGYAQLAEIPALYSAAVTLVFPSLYEGFGLPVLEAMACGCPVACSGVTSLPEVAGGAALLFDPTDVEDIAAKLGAVIADAGLRDDLRRRGLVRAAAFDWPTCAAATLRAYEGVLERGYRRGRKTVAPSA